MATLLGIHAHSQSPNWYYLPWKWAMRFGHGGWICLRPSWLWRFRNFNKPVSLNKPV
jgi:hypothetical protein